MTEFYEAPRIPLTRGQRISVAGLGILTILIVVVLGMQFNSTLYANATRHPTGDTAITDPNALAQQEIDRLKKTDTDGDGLSDYDEIYIYHTSPYLKDTDGDGVPDGEEVQRGTDPLCPEGKDCSLNPLYASVSASTTPASAQVQLSAPISVTPAGTDATAPTQNISSADMQKVRDTLISQGVPKAQIDQLSDTDLMNILVQAEQQQQAQARAQAGASSGAAGSAGAPPASTQP